MDAQFAKLLDTQVLIAAVRLGAVGLGTDCSEAIGSELFAWPTKPPMSRAGANPVVDLPRSVAAAARVARGRAGMIRRRSSSPECTMAPDAECSEDHDDAHVHDQPSPEVVAEEQDVDADHEARESKHVEHDGKVLAHVSCRSGGDSRKMGFRLIKRPRGDVGGDVLSPQSHRPWAVPPRPGGDGRANRAALPSTMEQFALLGHASWRSLAGNQLGSLVHFSGSPRPVLRVRRALHVRQRAQAPRPRRCRAHPHLSRLFHPVRQVGPAKARSFACLWITSCRALCSSPGRTSTSATCRRRPARWTATRPPCP